MEFGTVDLTDWFTIIALILGPALAAGLVIWRDHYVRKEAILRDELRDENARKEAIFRDEKLEKKNRQIAVFRTLWANRSIADYSILLRFESINLVPVVFHENDEICGYWRSYMDAASVLPFTTDEDFKTHKAYLKLLKNIADYLGYKFTNDDLNRDYFPNVTLRKFAEEAFIREGLGKLFSEDGELLPIAVKAYP